MDFVKYYKPYMCDSSGWASVLQYGQLSIYDKNGKFVKAERKNFASAPKGDLARVLAEYEINPKDLASKKGWTNTGRGESPIERIAYRSYVKLQKEVGLNLNTKLFMALSSESNVRLTLDAVKFWKERKSK
jgi:hypothetical protein